MLESEESELLRLAGAIADRTPVDWKSETASRPEQRRVIEQLRAVEALAAVHRSRSSEPDPPEYWGSLRILGKLAQGGFAVVYRAMEPTLGREVALKLWRLDRTWQYSADRFLEEARQLARLRHPNVLVVYGADVHEGRAGLWTELLQGETLEECIRKQGSFGAQEAALIGMTLCGALAAVHACGLVHRDVKTSNVMREAGGRIVLMDFGAVAGFEGERRVEPMAAGTLQTMAPEQLRGEKIGPAADIYGLGVLLYRLVSAHYPVPGESMEELLHAHQRGTRVPLRDVRPDLPTEFLQVVEQALDPLPGRRFPSVGAMERALADSLVSVSAARRRGRAAQALPRRSWLWAVAGIAVAAGLAWLSLYGPARRVPDRAAEPRSESARSLQPAGLQGGLPEDQGPKATRTAETTRLSQGSLAAVPRGQPLVATATLFRESQGSEEPLAPGAYVFPGDSLFLTIESADDMFAYVLDEDADGGIFVLFPVSGLGLVNPLAGRVRHRLPGTRGHKQLSWQVTSAGGKEKVVVIASRHPLAELEREIASFTPAAPGHPVTYGRVPPAAITKLRGIGGVVETPASEPDQAAPRLTELVRSLSRQTRGPDDPWLWAIVLENPTSEPR